MSQESSTKQELSASHDILIDLWPSGAFTKGDLENAASALESLGRVGGRISHDLRGIEIQIGIAILSEIAKKFLEELATDAYQFVRRAFVAAIMNALRRRQQAREESRNEGALITVSWREDGVRVLANCRFTTDEQVEQFLRALAKVPPWLEELQPSPGAVEANEVWLLMTFGPENLPAGWKNTEGQMRYEIRAEENGSLEIVSQGTVWPHG